jgi:hypothetical protein
LPGAGGGSAGADYRCPIRDDYDPKHDSHCPHQGIIEDLATGIAVSGGVGFAAAIVLWIFSPTTSRRGSRKRPGSRAS